MREKNRKLKQEYVRFYNKSGFVVLQNGATAKVGSRRGRKKLRKQRISSMKRFTNN